MSARLVHTAAFLAIVGSALALTTGGALAQQGGGKGRDMVAEVQKRFAAADVDHDGKLTRAEAQAGMPRLYKHFDEIDTGKTGAITLADIAAYAKQRGESRKAGS